MTDAAARDFILSSVDRFTGYRGTDWPGVPIGHIPVVMSSELNAMVGEGLVEIVERPAKVDPSKTRAFVRRVTY